MGRLGWLPHPLILAGGVVIVLSGCVDKQSVTQIGPDMYGVSASADGIAGGADAARTAALQRGGAFCRASGRELLATNISTHMLDRSEGAAVDVTFLCLAPGDPRFQKFAN